MSEEHILEADGIWDAARVTRTALRLPINSLPMLGGSKGCLGMELSAAQVQNIYRKSLTHPGHYSPMLSLWRIIQSSPSVKGPWNGHSDCTHTHRRPPLPISATSHTLASLHLSTTEPERCGPAVILGNPDKMGSWCLTPSLGSQ